MGTMTIEPIARIVSHTAASQTGCATIQSPIPLFCPLAGPVTTQRAPTTPPQASATGSTLAMRPR